MTSTSDPAGEVMDSPPVTQDDFWAQNPPNQPTSSGRMFITPTPAPTLDPDQQAALQSRLAAATAGPAFSRVPIAPPAAFDNAPGLPDMQEGIRAAMSNLPMKEAMQAIDLAMQYQGQRGYAQDTQNGMPAPKALAKWGPMLFGRNSNGMATAIRLAQGPQVTPITPAQAQAHALAVRAMNLKEKADQDALTPLQKHDLSTRATAMHEAQRALSTAIASQDTEAIGTARKDFDQAKADYDALRTQLGPMAPPAAPVAAPIAPPPAPAVVPPPGIVTRVRNALFAPGPTPAPAQPMAEPTKTVKSQAQYDALPPGAVYIGKNGKRYRKPPAAATTQEE